MNSSSAASWLPSSSWPVSGCGSRCSSLAWRVARSLDKLLEQINTLAPKRSKVSDGSIGDPAHSSRESDHNPDPFGVVRARDFTHDPENGADMNDIAAALVASRDPRIKYIIWRQRIVSSTINPWVWRTYTGTNPHDHHMHISVVPDARADQTAEWELFRKDEIDMATKEELRSIIREELEKELKSALNDLRKDLATGGEQYDKKKVNLKAVLDKK